MKKLLFWFEPVQYIYFFAELLYSIVYSARWVSMGLNLWRIYMNEVSSACLFFFLHFILNRLFGSKKQIKKWRIRNLPLKKFYGGSGICNLHWLSVCRYEGLYVGNNAEVLVMTSNVLRIIISILKSRQFKRKDR